MSQKSTSKSKAGHVRDTATGRYSANGDAEKRASQTVRERTRSNSYGNQPTHDNVRDAETGRFVDPSEAEHNPRGTIVERRNV